MKTYITERQKEYCCVQYVRSIFHILLPLPLWSPHAQPKPWEKLFQTESHRETKTPTQTGVNPAVVWIGRNGADTWFSFCRKRKSYISYLLFLERRTCGLVCVCVAALPRCCGADVEHKGEFCSSVLHQLHRTTDW